MESEPAPVEPEVIPAEPEPKPEPAYPIEPEGSLRDLWDLWKGPAKLEPPTLFLTDERGAEALRLEDEALVREQQRVKQKVERDAKLRMQLIHTIEAKGNTAALAATCSCILSKERRVAWLFVFPPTGSGDQMLADDVRRVLSKEQVTVGIDEEAVLRAANADHYFELIPAAVGIPATEGENGRIVEHFPREVVREVLVDQEGNADYRAQSYVQVVKENQLLCDIIPPVEGTAGQNVDGTPVKPKRVKAAHVPKGDGTKVSEDGLQLLAARDGHLEYRVDSFCVQPVLDISGDVDYATGNVDYPGDVHVAGDVREGFRVVTGGSLMIDGLVEGAEVTAGSDLVITKGVVGDNRAILRCGGDLRAKYLENCTVYAGKSIYADCTVTSRVYCNESVSVVGGRGSIIGGSVTAGTQVTAKLLGARSGRQTELILGERPYTLRHEQDLKDRMTKLEAEETAAEKDHYYLTHLADHMRAADREQQLAETEETLQQLKEDKEALLKLQEENGVGEIDLNKCRVECDTVYPITTISVAGKVWTVDRVRNHYKVGYDKKLGELTERI